MLSILIFMILVMAMLDWVIEEED